MVAMVHVTCKPVLVVVSVQVVALVVALVLVLVPEPVLVLGLVQGLPALVAARWWHLLPPLPLPPPATPKWIAMQQRQAQPRHKLPRR